MAIGTFSELKTALANWLNRADLTDRIPEFIALAEARMNRDRRFRVNDAIYRDTLSVAADEQFVVVPSDFARIINLEIYGSDPLTTLEYLTPQQMDVVRGQTATGTPKYYCLYNNGLELVPVTSEAFTLGIAYYRSIPALSDSATTNWLLTYAPDIYLYACKVEACLYLHDDDRLPVLEGMYNQRCAEYFATSQEDETGGAPLMVRGSVIG